MQYEENLKQIDGERLSLEIRPTGIWIKRKVKNIVVLIRECYRHKEGWSRILISRHPLYIWELRHGLKVVRKDSDYIFEYTRETGIDERDLIMSPSLNMGIMRWITTDVDSE